jgi:hypothetical protein
VRYILLEILKILETAWLALFYALFYGLISMIIMVLVPSTSNDPAGLLVWIIGSHLAAYITQQGRRQKDLAKRLEDQKIIPPS